MTSDSCHGAGPSSPVVGGGGRVGGGSRSSSGSSRPRVGSGDGSRTCPPHQSHSPPLSATPAAAVPSTSTAAAAASDGFAATAAAGARLQPGPPHPHPSAPAPIRPPPWISSPSSAAAAAAAGPAVAGPTAMDALTLRFSDPRVERDYQQHQTRRFMAVDRAGLLVTTLLLLLSWLVRGGRPSCQPAIALTSLTFLANALASLALQSCRAAAAASSAEEDRQPRLRTSYTIAVRLGYTAAAACFTAPCRRDEYVACSPSPTSGRMFGLDTGLVTMLYGTVAMPLPYREHLGVSAAAVAMLVALHNEDACSAMRGTCYSAWFDSLERHRVVRWLLAAGRPFAPRRPLPLSRPLQACWGCMLLAQLVAGFLLPAGVIYLIEEAARRRFLAGWHRRHGQLRQQEQRQQEQRQ